MLEFEVRGLEQLERRLVGIGISLEVAGREALHAEAEIEMTEAKQRTPVDTGALRASGRVVSAESGDPETRLIFGGPGADYAVPVHEDLEAFHAVGQAKYLESVVLESAPHMGARVAAYIRRKLAL